jgi:putative ABC transport system permease protein
VAVATLAIGIGGSAALFSVVDGVVVRPLPYEDPSRLVVLDQWLLRAEYALLRERARSYEELATYRGGIGVGVAGRGEPVRLTAAHASATLFDVLGVRPLMGRGFEPADERGGGEPVVVLTYGLWQEWFGGGTVLGERLLIDGAVHTVVGVMPRGFTFPAADTRLWLPMRIDASETGTYWGTVGGAGARPAARGRDAGGRARRGRGGCGGDAAGEPLVDAERAVPRGRAGAAAARADDGRTRRPLLLLLGATGFVLLIACANVANLFLVRVIGRRHDLAVRAALGGGRGGIVRTVAVESALLATAGGLLGVAAGYALLHALCRCCRRTCRGSRRLRSTGALVLFALLATALAAALFSLLPALRLSSGDPLDALRSGGAWAKAAIRGASPGWWSARRSRSRSYCCSARRCWCAASSRCSAWIPDSDRAA